MVSLVVGQINIKQELQQNNYFFLLSFIYLFFVIILYFFKLITNPNILFFFLLLVQNCIQQKKEQDLYRLKANQMNQSTQQAPKQLWQMQNRNIYTGMPIFKMKLRPQVARNNQTEQKPHVLFPISKAKKVVEYSSGLKTLEHIYNFDYEPHALQIMSIDHNNAESKTFVVAGSTDGKIMCQPLIHKTELQQASQYQQLTKFILNNKEDKNPHEVFINEIMDLGKGKIVNCFNNGTLAFWDLAERKRIHTMERVHSSYTYKLRRVQERLISCGHDGMTVVTDLLKLKPIRGLQNADSCWCAYPINYNLIASVGLFRRINIWDIRIRSLTQSIALLNHQSSFITAFDHSKLVFGDGNILKKCDLRTMSCNTFTSQQMLLSAQHIIVDKDGTGGYACGRKNEVCRFEAVSQLHPQIKATKTIFDPFNPSQIVPAQILNNDLRNFHPAMMRHFLAQMLVGNDGQELMDELQNQEQQEDEEDWQVEQQEQQQQQQEELYQQQQQMMGEDSELLQMEEQKEEDKYLEQQQLGYQQSVQRLEQQQSRGEQMLMSDQSQESSQNKWQSKQ